MRGRRCIVLVAALHVGIPSHAQADNKARVDWQNGVVLADGLGVADRHAPSPAVALGTSRRPAEDAARRVLRDRVGSLPLAAGGTVAMHANDGDVKDRLARAIADAFVTAAEPETDGSWHVTLALPIEAVRQAVAGPRQVGATGDADPAVVIVEGAGTAKPAVGYRIGGVAAAVVFVTEIPAWAHDAPRARATRVQAGVIELARPAGGPGTLFVVIGDRQGKPRGATE